MRQIGHHQVQAATLDSKTIATVTDFTRAREYTKGLPTLLLLMLVDTWLVLNFTDASYSLDQSLKNLEYKDTPQDSWLRVNS